MTEAMPFLQKTILLSYDPRSLIAGVFSAKGAVIDSLHHDVGCDSVGRLAMSDYKGSIAELADYTGCTIGSIQDRFHGRVIKNRICTACLFQFPFNVSTSFFF